MTVQELIDKLRELPSDAPLFVRGYEGGLNDVNAIIPTKVKLNANDEWWYGAHEPVLRADEEDWDAEGYEVSV